MSDTSEHEKDINTLLLDRVVIVVLTVVCIIYCTTLWPLLAVAVVRAGIAIARDE
jgi:nitrate reductase NapE component